MNFEVTLNGGICNCCKKKDFIAPNGFCLSCTAKKIRTGELPINEVQ